MATTQHSISSKWISAPFESNTSGNLILCTVRTDTDKFRDNPKYHYRVDVSWKYDAADKGMPSEKDSELMEQVLDALETTFVKDPIAIVTGIYTGEGVRNIIIYTLSLNIFQKKLNEILEPFPILPLSFDAEDDPHWEEYSEMLSAVLKIDEEN